MVKIAKFLWLQNVGENASGTQNRPLCGLYFCYFRQLPGSTPNSFFVPAALSANRRIKRIVAKGSRCKDASILQLALSARPLFLKSIKNNFKITL
jgi:hypothetical protein